MIAIDTNILVYAFDVTDTHKHTISKQIFENAISGKREIVITNQVLAEFINVSTRKIPVPLTRTEAAIVTSAIIQNRYWITYNYTSRSVAAAASAKQPFWDALLAQTLIENGVREIYTENVKDFAGSGVKAINPFRK